MNHSKNQKIESEIRHVLKTVLPIIIFTVIVITATLFVVSWINDIPFKVMVEQFYNTLRLVLTFF